MNSGLFNAKRVRVQRGSQSKFAPYPPFGPVPQFRIDNRHVPLSPSNNK